MAEPAAERRPRREGSLLALFRIRVFRRMWAAIAFSSFGDWLGLLANTALAQQLTRSDSVATQGAAISGVLLVRLAPDLLFGAIAAAIADKLDRRKVVIAGEVSAALLYASIAIGYNLIWLYIAQFAIEAAGLFTQPAKQVIWVAIVPRKLLATANQISLMSVYGTVPIASAAFALLSAADRVIGGESTATSESVNTAIVIALLLNTLTFLVSASTVFLSRNDIPVVPAQREQEQGIFSLIREGVAFVRTHPLIRGLYIGIIGAFAGGGLTVGVAQLWVLTLDAGAAGYSLMFGAVFTGLAVGLLLGPRMLPGFSRTRVFGLSIGGAGVALVISSLIHDYILALALATLVGGFAGMAWIIGYTLIGHEVEDRLRGRTFAFVLSSVRLSLLASIALGPVLAGFIGTHVLKVGHSHLVFTGPGLTLLIGGVIALLVSVYATSQSGRTKTRLRDVLRRRLIRGIGRDADQAGLLFTVEGVDARATSGYAALLGDAVRALGLVVVDTAEPTDSPVGRRVAELLAGDASVEPETAALLSAADRAEHVATLIRPAIERGEVVVCDRFVLTSLALHGAGRGADVERIRGVYSWSTDALTADLALVVVDPDGLDPDGLDPAAHALRTEAEMDPDRCVICPTPAPDVLPAAVLERLQRLVDVRRAMLADAAAAPGEPAHSRGRVSTGGTATLWQREDTEAVPCCVCQREGRPIYDLDPFGVVRCPRCTLVFVSPRLRPEALDKLYGDPDYHAGIYDSSRGAMFLQRRWISGRLALAQRELGRPPTGARLLEGGAGRGTFLAAARHAGFDVVGVELSPGAAAHARRTHDLTVHPAQLEEAPLDGRFDVICAWDTIEHVPDPVRFWRSVRGLLADDGVVLFSTPYFSSLPSRVLRARWWTLKPTEHIWHFTPRTHRTVAAQADMAVTDIVRSPFTRANFGRLDSLVGVARAAAA